MPTSKAKPNWLPPHQAGSTPPAIAGGSSLAKRRGRRRGVDRRARHHSNLLRATARQLLHELLQEATPKTTIRAFEIILKVTAPRQIGISITTRSSSPASDPSRSNIPTPEPEFPPAKTTLELVSELLTEPGRWLRTPNPQFGNRSPIDLIDTPDEVLVRNALQAFQLGLF